MALDNFLPAIFRRRRPEDFVPEYPNNLRSNANDMMYRYGRDDQKFVPSNYALAQEPVAAKSPILPTPAPVGLPPEPNPYNAPANIAAPVPSMRELGAAPTMTRLDKSGRPMNTIGGTPAERIMAERQAIENYDPNAHKPKGWWNRFLKPALMKAGVGFMYGGLGGALGGAAEGLIEGGFAPGRANRLWKERQMARSDQQIKNVYDQAKEQAQIESTQSTTDLNKARAQQLRQPKAAAKRYIERSDGVYEISDANPEGRKIANVPPEARTKNPNPTRYFEREDGVYGINDEHPEGFKVKGVPGKPKADTGQAELTNQMIDQNIAEADAEQQKLGPAPEIYVDTIDPLTGESKRTVNPAYTNWENRYQKLDDDKRRWRAQKKAVGKGTSNTPAKGGQRTYKVDPKFL